MIQILRGGRQTPCRHLHPRSPRTLLWVVLIVTSFLGAPVLAANLSGTVFEDVNYGGGAGRSLAASAGVVRSGARVELYDGGGNYVSSTTTGGGGTYSFTGIASGTFTVRVVNSSVTSSRTGYSASLRSVQTYRTDASGGSAVAVTDHVGGQDPTVSDAGNGSPGTVMNTLSGVFSSGITGVAQSITTVAVGAGNISGLDFGFNFNTIVNTNDPGQGSLRQFRNNANALANGGLAQTGRPAGIDNAIFMLADGTARPGMNAGYANLFVGGIATISPASLISSYSEAVVLDATTQPGFGGTPILELSGAIAGLADGFALFGGGSTVAGWIINRFDANGIYIFGSSSNTVTGNWIGTNSTGTAASPNIGNGVSIDGPGNNVVGGTAAGAGNILSGNIGNGISIRLGGSNNNVVQGNFIGTNSGGTNLGNTLNGIRIIDGSNNTIGGTTPNQSNVIAHNGLNGILAYKSAGTPNQNSFLLNSVHSNTQLGIDLGNDGVTPNNGTKNASLSNNDMDAPVFTSAGMVGPTLTVAGYVGSAPGQPLFQNARVEIFESDVDASGFGEGRIYLGFLTTDASGNFSGSIVTSGLPASFNISGTATDVAGGTSEFGANTLVQVIADLTLSKTDAPDPAPSNGPLVYTLLIVNNGPDAASGVTVTDTLPASVSLVSATPSQGSCPGTAPITCNLGTILNSGTASVEILVTTSGTGTITNNASVTANEPDPVPGDNAAAENTSVVDSPISDVPLTQYRRIHGFLDYAVTGGTFRTEPNSGDACAVGPTSTASLSGIPGTATVTDAFLYWAGSSISVDNQVTFDGVALTADRTFQAQFTLGATDYDFFGGFEDVTAQVAAKGNGSYSLQDLSVDTGNPFCSASAVLAGWSLIVIYDDSSLSGKTLLLYDGFDLERNSSTSYILTGIWAADPPEAKSTFVVWEGDADLGGVDERFEFNAVAQSDGLNPVDNIYNSTINSLPSSTTYGADTDTFDVSGEITAGDTLATMGLFTGPDLVILNAAVLQVKSNIITGTVFEDVNYGGGPGRDLATATTAAPSFSVGRPGATVELYNAPGALIRTTTTGPNGEYGFAGLINGDYRVRVVNDTVSSSRTGADGNEWPVQTYRTDASTGTAVSVTNEVGGSDPTAQDDPANGGSDNLSTLSAQSLSAARIVTGVTVADVDFGYNFDTIVNSNDSSQGSLRQLILNANDLTDDASLSQSGLGAGVETSVFMIPATDSGYNAGTNSVLIQPTSSALPLSSDPLVLDGTTQPGYDGTPGIDLDGSLLAGPNLNGFESDQVNQTIRGFVIRNFSGTGIHLTGSGQNTIQANYIGTNVDGLTAQPNQVGLFLGSGADTAVIGGTTGSDRNVIAFNSDDGVQVDSVVAVSILGNSLFGNGGLGIDLAGGSENAAGVTANDGGDVDTGSNDLLNFPEISSAVESAGVVSVNFDIDLLAGDYRVEFFTNPSGADPSGNGEGETFTSSRNINHSGGGIESFSHSFPGAAGDVLSATATICTNGATCSTFASTSELSATFVTIPLAIVKRAFQSDGTPISSGSALPVGLPFKFMLYINNPGELVSDVSLQDVLNPAFAYVPGSITYDNSVLSCAAATCTGAEELAIFATADTSPSATDAVDGDVVSFAGVTVSIGNQNAGNAQLDLAAGRVWAVVFTALLN